MENGVDGWRKVAPSLAPGANGRRRMAFPVAELSHPEAVETTLVARGGTEAKGKFHEMLPTLSRFR
jgi:hypothetical protein